MSEHAYKTGSGTGTRTVEARQLVSATDYELAHWAGGAMHQDARREPEVRIYPQTSPESTDIPLNVVARRYDWIVKDKKGNVKVVSPEAFRDKYRKAETEEDTK
jgi:hypothetical protein